MISGPQSNYQHLEEMSRTICVRCKTGTCQSVRFICRMLIFRRFLSCVFSILLAVRVLTRHRGTAGRDSDPEIHHWVVVSFIILESSTESAGGDADEDSIGTNREQGLRRMQAERNPSAV